MAARLSVRYPGDPADIEAAVLAAFLAELGRIDICGDDLPGPADRHRRTGRNAALAVALYAHDHTAPDTDRNEHRRHRPLGRWRNRRHRR